MRKIMLVIDDYQELVVFENLLRRLGFDVLSLGKDLLVSDALFRFHPDIVIATAKGRSVDGFKVGARVKKQFPPPRVALAYANGSPPTLTSETKMIVDGLIAVPVQAANVIKLVARLANLEPEPLLEKFRKISEAWDPVKTPGRAATLRSERSNRYDAFLRDHTEEPAQKVLPREPAQTAMEELKTAAESEREKIDQINREKLEFAEAMFGNAGEGKNSRGKK